MISGLKARGVEHTGLSINWLMKPMLLINNLGYRNQRAGIKDKQYLMFDWRRLQWFAIVTGGKFEKYYLVKNFPKTISKTKTPTLRI